MKSAREWAEAIVGDDMAGSPHPENQQRMYWVTSIERALIEYGNQKIEECAKVAAEMSREFPTPYSKPGIPGVESSEGVTACVCIATNIRALKETKKEE
jgi:hypothetical protein